MTEGQGEWKELIYSGSSSVSCVLRIIIGAAERDEEGVERGERSEKQKIGPAY